MLEPSSTDFTNWKPCAKTVGLWTPWTAELWGMGAGSGGGDTRMMWSHSLALQCKGEPAIAASAASVPGSPGTSCHLHGTQKGFSGCGCLWGPTSYGQATCQWTGQVELITSLSNTEKELFWIFHSRCQNRNSTSASFFSFSLTSHPERNQDLALSNAVESSRGSWRQVHELHQHKYL